jgi:hypothetical protein
MFLPKTRAVVQKFRVLPRNSRARTRRRWIEGMPEKQLQILPLRVRMTALEMVMTAVLVVKTAVARVKTAFVVVRAEEPD